MCGMSDGGSADAGLAEPAKCFLACGIGGIAPRDQLLGAKGEVRFDFERRITIDVIPTRHEMKQASNSRTYSAAAHQTRFGWWVRTPVTAFVY